MSADLHLGEAATILKERISLASVDMVYSDPPFGNEQIWTGKAGAFSDKWQWGAQAEAGWRALREHSPVGADLVAAVTPPGTAQAYIGMMAGLLVAVHGALRLTGSLWLHFDDTMGAHIRILGDAVFGPENQLGTIIWHRSSGRSTRKGYARVHDTIAVFARSRVTRWRLDRINGEFVTGDPCFGVRVDGFCDDRLSATATERVGYPTQKPLALVSRFIRSGSLPGDTVLDPTCGSGTTLVAAEQMGRRAIGIDISPDALNAARSRLSRPVPTQGELFSAAA